jgi:hypothetical protein
MGEGIWVFIFLVGFGLSENELHIEENVPPPYVEMSIEKLF